MRIIITENYDDMSNIATDIIAAQLILNPDSVLGLATGSTPTGMYEGLVKLYNEGRIDFKDVVTFNLDEYCGLPDENDQSYHYFMDKNLLSKVNVAPENINIPSGVAEDMEKTCIEYDEKIQSFGGTDIQVLGIGVNGHIGFNEPGDVFVGETHIIDLDETTIEANARFFEKKDDVPKQAITMGMRSIMSAGRILLMASGSGKAKAIYDAIKGPITPLVPASILQLHEDVIVVVDKEAAKLITDMV